MNELVNDSIMLYWKKPDGTSTINEDEYDFAWIELGIRVAKFFKNCVIISVNPDDSKVNPGIVLELRSSDSAGNNDAVGRNIMVNRINLSVKAALRLHCQKCCSTECETDETNETSKLNKINNETNHDIDKTERMDRI